MSQQLIDIGSTPNDGTGDKPRPAAIKINENFTELYELVEGLVPGGVDPNLIILDSVVFDVSVGGIDAGFDTDGVTLMNFIRYMGSVYVPPQFGTISVTGQALTVEVGTTLSGSKTFNWVLTVNNGVVTLVDIYDNTAVSTTEYKPLRLQRYSSTQTALPKAGRLSLTIRERRQVILIQTMLL